MHFTHKQVSEIIAQFIEKKGGLNEILKMSLEALMRSERSLHNAENDDYSNGYRSRKVYGDKQMIELKIPRTRDGGFYPVILGLLKNQEAEARAIAFKLYKSGLTTEQVGELFDDIYGCHYSSSQVSRMFDNAREEVSTWLNRPLEPYYPLVYIDACFIPTRRVESVSKEAYFTLLAVRADRTREVLGVYNYPTEGSTAWEDIFKDIKRRGVHDIGLFVSDSLKGIEDSICKYFSQASVQLCVVHLNRTLQKEVKPKDKEELAKDFRDVFRTDDRNDTIELATNRFARLCDKWADKGYSYFKKRKENVRNYLHFTYIAYDYRIRSLIYTTNWVERLNRDYKRTTRMRGALPNPEATILLLGGVSMSRKNYERKVPKLNYEQEKFNWEQ